MSYPKYYDLSSGQSGSPFEQPWPGCTFFTLWGRGMTIVCFASAIIYFMATCIVNKLILLNKSGQQESSQCTLNWLTTNCYLYSKGLEIDGPDCLPSMRTLWAITIPMWQEKELLQGWSRITSTLHKGFGMLFLAKWSGTVALRTYKHLLAENAQYMLQ